MKIKEKQLVDKSGIAEFINNFDLNKKLAKLTPKKELETEQDKTTKLEAFHLSYFCGQSHFEDDGTENYLVFQPMDIYILRNC